MKLKGYYKQFAEITIDNPLDVVHELENTYFKNFKDIVCENDVLYEDDGYKRTKLNDDFTTVELYKSLFSLEESILRYMYKNN